MDFAPLDLDLPRPADQPRTRPRQAERQPLGRRRAQQRFLELPAALHEHGPLPGLQSSCRLAIRGRFRPVAAGEPLFQVVRQGQIEIIAAEDQVIADGHAVELHLAAFAAADADQREVGRAAADVADENLLTRFDKLVPSVSMGIDPGIERGLRFFDQHDSRQAGQGGRLDRQLPCHFIERGRQREHEILLGQRMLREAGVPSGADVGQVARADLDRRQPLDVGRSVPREKRGRAVDARVTEPRLGRADQPPRHHGPMIAGEKADDMRRFVALGRCPGQTQRGRRQFARAGLVMEGGKRLAGFHLAGGHQLRHGKNADLPRFFARVDVGDGRVRRPQVKPDDITAERVFA